MQHSFDFYLSIEFIGEEETFTLSYAPLATFSYIYLLLLVQPVCLVFFRDF